jgi:DNA-binding response OmpR family regulator
MTEGRPVPHPDRALRVLVADPDHDAADSTCRNLRHYGHDCLAAYGADDALAKAELFRPQVVLLDLPALPRLGGMGARLVVVSGWSGPAHRQQAADAGAAHYFLKPADPAELNAVLASLRPGGP